MITNTTGVRFAAALGSSTPSACVPPTATTSALLTGTAASVFGWRERSRSEAGGSLPLGSLPLYPEELQEAVEDK